MIEWLARLIPFFPLAACLVTLVLGPRVLREKCHWPAIVGCGLSALCSLILAALVASPQILPQDERTVPLFEWVHIDDSQGAALLDVTLALRVDSLSATMLAMLTFVATLVTIYAAGYMHGDRGYWRFFTEVWRVR
jgi:NADH-quinone oxidoreductase subunit L